MPEAWNGINPLKSSLLSQFLHRIKVEIYTYPSSAFPTQLKPYHVCSKDFLSSQLASEISKDARPERHGHIERSNSTLGNKSSLARVVSGQLSTGKQICLRGLLLSFLSRPSRDHCFHRPIKITTGCVFQILRARSIQPKFAVQNQIFGQPVVLFSRKFGNSGNFLFHWSYHFAGSNFDWSMETMVPWRSWQAITWCEKGLAVSFTTDVPMEKIYHVHT